MTSSESRPFGSAMMLRATSKVFGGCIVIGSRIGCATRRSNPWRSYPWLSGARCLAETEDLARRLRRIWDLGGTQGGRVDPAKEQGDTAAPLAPDQAGLRAARGRGRSFLLLGMLAAYPGPAISQASSWAISCPPPLKLAAGACVRSCPSGYADAGRTCVFQDMSH